MIIDHCYEGVVKKLTTQGKIQDISHKLLSLVNNNERVLYVYEILQNLNAFPKVIKLSKSEEASLHYRNLGNQCFQKKDNSKAWQYYNKSLLHAPLTCDSYSLALANRSAVFFGLHKYKECLVDIQKVFSVKYPEKLKDKLVKRQNMCKEFLLKDQNEAGDLNCQADMFKLVGPTNPRYPCASSKLQVVFNKEMGRHVIAKEDIKVGEVLAEEEPYFLLLMKTQLLFNCSYCLSMNPNLLPCDFCCYALYCSEKCKDAAWKEYHKVECSLTATLIDMDFTKLELLALRTVIKARTDHSSWTSLFQTVKEAEANMNTELHGHVKVDGEWVYDSKHYASIHTLETNLNKRSVSDIFQKALTAAVFLNFLSDETDFVQDEDKALENEIRKFVAGALLLHIMTSPTNMHGLTSNTETEDGKCVEEVNIASAAYAFHSLLNHSCAPNVVRFSNMGSRKMTLFALRPIKKGMQLLDNYGAHHALCDRQTRRSELMFQYKFMCRCEACVNDWPTYLSMCTTSSTGIPQRLSEVKNRLLDANVISLLEKGDKDKAVKWFPILCNLCEKLDQYAPCRELSDCQESIKQCLAILKGLVPYGQSQSI